MPFCNRMEGKMDEEEKGKVKVIGRDGKVVDLDEIHLMGLDLDFPAALQVLLDGKRVRRSVWPNDGTYLAMASYRLMIRLADGQLHPLVVSRGDILGRDWRIV